MRTDMLEETIIEEVTNIVKVAETKIMEKISIQYLADLLWYSEQQVRLVFKMAAGQAIGRYLKRRYLTHIYLTIGSDAYSKLKKTAAVMGCERYKQKMEHFFGKVIDEDKLQRPLTTEQMRLNLINLENSPYIDRWLKEKICGKRQRVDIGNDVTRLLLLDENNQMPYDYDHCYFKYKDRLFIIDSRLAVDIPYKNSLWIMGMELCIYKTEQAENRYVLPIIKKFIENGTVKNMKERDSGIQLQELSYFYARKNKSFHMVNIIEESGISSGELIKLMIKEKCILLESGKLFFLLGEK